MKTQINKQQNYGKRIDEVFGYLYVSQVVLEGILEDKFSQEVLEKQSKETVEMVNMYNALCFATNEYITINLTYVDPLDKDVIIDRYFDAISIMMSELMEAYETIKVGKALTERQKLAVDTLYKEYENLS